jgi:two-component system phosphate regulon sensor histidine kinase PhoR
MIYIIAAILCFGFLFLIIKLNLIIKCLREIIIVLDDIILGNKSRVCHITINSKTVLRLGQSINSLILDYQSYVEKEKSNEILTKKLISEISHDIRTPLTSILGYMDILSGNKSLTEENKNRYIEIISLKGQALHKYIDDLFEYVKLEADDITIKLSRQNLSEIVRTMLCFLYQDFAKENLTPLIESPEKDLYVLGDGTSINRILQNLLYNALCYGKSGNCIGISIREESDKVWVDVWDKGKGIGQEEIKYIFARLYTSRNSSSGGSGFGLSIAKRLVRKMNGEIYVNSIPDEKTVFSFFLKKC